MTEANTAAPAPAVTPLTPIQTQEPIADAPVNPMDLAALGLTPAQVAPTNVGGEDSGVVEMGLDDESVKAFDFDLYEGRKGQTDRLSIIDPNSIFAARVHYLKGTGFFICNSKYVKQSGQEVMTHQAPCCQKMDAPRKRFACMVVQYTTHPDGTPQNPLGFSLKMWRFSEDKYVQIRNIHKEYSLAQHDITVMCTEPKYQKLTIQNCKVSFWRLPAFPQAFKDQITTFVQANKPKMMKLLGRKKTEAELLEILGLATQASVVGGEMPLTDLNSLLPANG